MNGPRPDTSGGQEGKEKSAVKSTFSTKDTYSLCELGEVTIVTTSLISKKEYDVFGKC